MTCPECQDVMLDVARDRAAPLIERAVFEHIAACADCRRDLQRERAVTAGLRAVALQHAGKAPSADIEARLLEAFASLQGDASRPAATDRPAATRVVRWLPLAATLALCAAGLTWWLTRPGPLVRPPEVARGPQQPTLPVQPIRSAEPVPTAAAPAPPRHRARRPSARPPIQAVGFVPIPSAAGLPEFESGQIVRLGIPVAALPNYGLEIPSGAESSIQADLLVGQDGQPRAIRLVNAMSQDSHPRR